MPIAWCRFCAAQACRQIFAYSRPPGEQKRGGRTGFESAMVRTYRCIALLSHRARDRTSHTVAASGAQRAALPNHPRSHQHTLTHLRTPTHIHVMVAAPHTCTHTHPNSWTDHVRTYTRTFVMFCFVCAWLFQSQRSVLVSHMLVVGTSWQYAVVCRSPRDCLASARSDDC